MRIDAFQALSECIEFLTSEIQLQKAAAEIKSAQPFDENNLIFKIQLKKVDKIINSDIVFL